MTDIYLRRYLLARDIAQHLHCVSEHSSYCLKSSNTYACHSLIIFVSGHSIIQERRPYAMDAISNSSDPFSSTSDPKSAIIKQIRQEAALSNARQLIDVTFSLP